MGLIIKKVKIAGDKGSTTVEALFDTGASACFIRRSLAKKVATITSVPKRRIFTLGDGKRTLQTNEFVQLDITLKRTVFFHPAVVVDQLADDLIIGADFLQRWKIKLDPETEEVIIDKKALELKLV